jgi:sarcosine oxidase subunit gamma
LPDGVYPVLRQDASLAMTGTLLQTLLRQTCNLNFKALDLATRPLALTTMVGVAVVIVPDEVAGQPFYRIWFDGTYGGYLWQTLIDIASEQGGGAVGLACLMQENSNHLLPQRSVQ